MNGLSSHISHSFVFGIKAWPVVIVGKVNYRLQMVSSFCSLTDRGERSLNESQRVKGSFILCVLFGRILLRLASEMI